MKTILLGKVWIRAAALILAAGLLTASPTTAQNGVTLPDHLGIKRSTRVRAASLLPTAELVVFLARGSSAAALAKEYKLDIVRPMKGVPDAYVLKAASTNAATTLLPRIQADRRVASAYQNEYTRHVPCSYWPDDPLFDWGYLPYPNDYFWNYGQWHLYNEYKEDYGYGVDVNIAPAWDRQDMPGAGVVIGIVDDSVESTHEDLAPNFDMADSWNFVLNINSPDPTESYDGHGVSVAGVAAARGGNGIGVTGAAPFATLSGQKITYDSRQTSAMFANATLYHSSGDNTTVRVKNHSYGYSWPFISIPLEVDALATSANAGTIHCFAAGNNRGYWGQDAVKLATSSSPDVICVAGLDFYGYYTYYSDFGACVFVTAPTSGSYGIVTTDRGSWDGYNGFPDPYLAYTPSFGGTSSASPLVAGIMALGKQAQPALDVRFAKHLLALTSLPVDLFDMSDTSDGGWRANAAGYLFNENYGFGLIDADKFTAEAVRYAGVTPRTVATTGKIVPPGRTGMIPDNDPRGLTLKFRLTGDQPLEEVLVKLEITHAYRGDLEAYLTSPGGTTRRLFIRSAGDNYPNINWVFTCNAFWGENPTGEWKLNVRDLCIMDRGTVKSYQVTARMGRLIPL